MCRQEGNRPGPLRLSEFSRIRFIYFRPRRPSSMGDAGAIGLEISVVVQGRFYSQNGASVTLPWCWSNSTSARTPVWARPEVLTA